MRFIAGLLLGVLLGLYVRAWLPLPTAFPLAPQTVVMTRQAEQDTASSRNPVRSEYMAVMSGNGRTSVALVAESGGWFEIQTLDGGMVTGHIGRFNPGLRIAQYDTAPAGWRIGGR